MPAIRKTQVKAPVVPRAPQAKSNPAAPARTLHVRLGADQGYRNSPTPKEMIVEVPAGCKVTYAATVPGDKSARGCALRIYQGTDNIALFRDVIEFRDVDLIKVKVKMVNTHKMADVEKRQDANGASVTKTTDETTTEHWVVL